MRFIRENEIRKAILEKADERAKQRLGPKGKARLTSVSSDVYQVLDAMIDEELDRIVAQGENQKRATPALGKARLKELGVDGSRRRLGTK